MVHVLTPPALILIAACGTLTACGDIAGALDFIDDRQAFQERVTSLQARSNTAYSAVPDSGSVVYRGDASMAVGGADVGVVLMGDAAITVDFDTSDVSGQLDNFGGFDRQEEYTDFNGTLTLEGGIVGSSNPNDVEAQIVGSLTGGGYVIDVDAFWEGHLKGTPIVGILGDTTLSSSTFELNGDLVTGGMVIAVMD